MSNETNFVGNGSTFVKYICFLLSGRILALAIAHGINLPIDQYALAELFGYIIGFIGATIDAKYHNNINWNYFKQLIGLNVSLEDEEDDI